MRASQLAGASAESVNASLAGFDQFATTFSDTATDLNGLVSDLGDQASALKEQLFARAELLAQGNASVPEVDRATALAAITAGTPAFETASAAMTEAISQLIAAAPAFPDTGVQSAFGKWKTKVRDYLATLPLAAEKLRTWSADEPVPWYRSISAFLFGRNWITASFWQDWYGIRPLLVGSIMVSLVALAFAVPLGVASAIYVSEIASRHERRFIKPYIEFISAIPSVVLGFFRHRGRWPGRAHALRTALLQLGAVFSH